MIEDIINAASNLVNTPGLLMMGVGVASAMVLKSLVYEANKSSTTLINYETDSDEFPLPIPLSIYGDCKESGISRANRVRPKSAEKAKCAGLVGNRPSSPACSKLVGLPKNEDVLEKANLMPDVLTEARYHEKASVVDMMSAYHDGCSKPQKTVSSNLPKPSKFGQLWEKGIQENSSDLAAGDTYLIVEPPEDSSESEKDLSSSSCSKTEAYTLNSITLSSFTGPLLAPGHVDESSSQSVTWTDAFVKREPFDDEISDCKPKESKSQMTKSKNQKC